MLLTYNLAVFSNLFIRIQANSPFKNPIDDKKNQPRPLVNGHTLFFFPAFALIKHPRWLP